MTTRLPKNVLIVSWVLRVALAGGFIVMGAVPKLTGQPMAREIFDALGVGAAGMYATGLAEALTGVLLLIPATTVYGGALTVLLMIGALGAHFTKLGFPMDPLPSEPAPPPMGFIAIAFLVLGAAVVFIHRKSLPIGGASAEPSGAGAGSA
ncbi:MAG: hypothetical protein D6693_01365 [Planctomycetota bacterium]|nr:MAG: hypothetical protein D6693_01365 [Planctomycetota bacterium]